MKYLLLALAMCTYINAEETMSTAEHQSLHTYNKNSFLKRTGEKRAHQLHKIDEKMAMKIAIKKCKDKSVQLTLNHQNSYLYFIAKAPECTVYINALDGSIIDPSTINKENRQ